MRTPIALLMLLLTLGWPAQADDAEGKAQLIQALRSRKYVLDAMVLERFVTIKASPEVWAEIGSETSTAYGSFNDFFTSLNGIITKIADNMGWGDVRDLDQKNGFDGSSPLVASMLDSWKGKMTFTVDLTSKLELKSKYKMIDNLETVYNPLSFITYFKPRGGNAFVTLKADPGAAKASVTVSKDGNTYFVNIPATATCSQRDLESGLKKGL